MIRFGFLTGMLIVPFMYALAYTSYSAASFQQLPLKNISEQTDTLPTDTTKKDTTVQAKKISSDSLDAPVKYHADDKTWMDVANKRVYLLGNAKVEYKDITLSADSIVFDWSTNEVIALGRKDTSGKEKGQPVFSQGEHHYKAERIAYNFKTKKGKITDITTQEGEGFIKSQTVKRLANQVLYGKNNIYTTCSLDHPHYYIEANKIKVIPNKAIVTGPATLVVADVPTPLVVPFGIFPLSDKRKSGIIVPTYGERQDLGFYLENGGYYFGISDHFDLALTGNIYSKGSWLLNAASRFISKYKFSGNFSVKYADNRTFVPELNRYSPGKQFSVNFNYAQDPKAAPNSHFNAAVQFATSGFNKTFGNTQYNNYLSNVYQSSISFQQTIPNSPFNFTISASHQQSTQTHVVNIQLPLFNFNMNQIYPFKRKLALGKQQWYEKIGLSYSLNARDQVSGIDSTLFTQRTLNNTLSGVQQSIPVSASFQFFHYITVSPSFNYRETWSFQEFTHSWDSEQNKLIVDTIQKFTAGRDYNFSLGASTRLYGVIQFKKGKIRAIRHVFNPSISYGYHPDFGDPRYKYYQTVQTDSLGHTQQFSIFQGAVYSGPPTGKFSGLNFSLNNNLEMKVASKKDTVTGTKKIKLLEALNLTGGYNFAADSLRFSVLNLAGRTTLFDKIGINFSSSFDPYISDSLGRRINVYTWDAERKLARLTGASVGIDARFDSPKKSESSKLTQQQKDYLLNSGNRYEDFSIPWSFSFGYNLFIRKINVSGGQDSTTFTQTLSINGSFNLTPNWRITGNTSYDFVNHKFPTAYLSISRDLHCWEMAMQWIPFGSRQSYQFTIRVKADVLQDLKLHKSSDWYQY
ncbi:MAG: putative LPS assembly protein LptD [Chitinophagales bacterium]